MLSAVAVGLGWLMLAGRAGCERGGGGRSSIICLSECIIKKSWESSVSVPIAGPGLCGMLGGVRARAASAATGVGRTPVPGTCRSALRTTAGTGTACAPLWRWNGPSWRHCAPRRARQKTTLRRWKRSWRGWSSACGTATSVHRRAASSSPARGIVSLLIERNRDLERRARSAANVRQIC